MIKQATKLSDLESKLKTLSNMVPCVITSSFLNLVDHFKLNKQADIFHIIKNDLNDLLYLVNKDSSFHYEDRFKINDLCKKIGSVISDLSKTEESSVFFSEKEIKISKQNILDISIRKPPKKVKDLKLRGDLSKYAYYSPGDIQYLHKLASLGFNTKIKIGKVSFEISDLKNKLQFNCDGQKFKPSYKNASEYLNAFYNINLYKIAANSGLYDLDVPPSKIKDLKLDTDKTLVKKWEKQEKDLNKDYSPKQIKKKAADSENPTETESKLDFSIEKNGAGLNLLLKKQKEPLGTVLETTLNSIASLNDPINNSISNVTDDPKILSEISKNLKLKNQEILNLLSRYNNVYIHVDISNNKIELKPGVESPIVANSNIVAKPKKQPPPGGYKYNPFAVCKSKELSKDKEEACIKDLHKKEWSRYKDDSRK